VGAPDRAHKVVADHGAQEAARQNAVLNPAPDAGPHVLRDQAPVGVCQSVGHLLSPLLAAYFALEPLPRRVVRVILGPIMTLFKQTARMTSQARALQCRSFSLPIPVHISLKE